MATEPGYTVLPVSALKDEVTSVFDALKDDKIVYVSNRGRIVAAFRPYTYVPEGVAALHVSPNLNLPFTITARDIGRGVPSKAVNEAAAGLPSIVAKDGDVFGMLTPATAPQPVSIPDPDLVGAKADAILDYQQRNPSASIDDVIDFAETPDAPGDHVEARRSWPLSAPESVITMLERDDAVADDIQDWREQGSEVEDIVEKVFDTARAIAEGEPTQDLALSDIGVDARRRNATPARVSVVAGERLQAAGDDVQARASYVAALEQQPSVGVMWRLGNLARSVGHPAEAARWFRLSLAYDTYTDSLESDDRSSVHTASH